MVCNFNGLKIRQFALLVYEESLTSSTPLFDRVCSMCGQLLESTTSLIKAEKRSHGKAGKAVQILDTEARWDPMPLFLLMDASNSGLLSAFHISLRCQHAKPHAKRRDRNGALVELRKHDPRSLLAGSAIRHAKKTWLESEKTVVVLRYLCVLLAQLRSARCAGERRRRRHGH